MPDQTRCSGANATRQTRPSAARPAAFEPAARNAATGAELYSSKDEIPSYADLSGVSVGDSHAFFTDHDNVLYSFGLPK